MAPRHMALGACTEDWLAAVSRWEEAIFHAHHECAALWREREMGAEWCGLGREEKLAE